MNSSEFPKKLTTPAINALRARIDKRTCVAPARLLYVNVASQTLTLVESNSTTKEYPVSTSQKGMGNISGSSKTPRGIHRIAAKAGADAPPGAIFKDRLYTGMQWTQGDAQGDLVLSRILRLEGLEPGVNQGPGIDSFDRFIYIHGTSHEETIGTPRSHGCVCMRNADVIELFDLVEEGDFVIID